MTYTTTTGAPTATYTTGGYSTGGYSASGNYGGATYVTSGSGVRQGETVTYTSTSGPQYVSSGSGVKGTGYGDVVTYTTNY